MSVTSGEPDITVPGLCHHLPITPAVSDRVSVRTTQAGTTAHADLLIGRTGTGGDVILSGDEADAAMFEEIAMHACRCASWLRGGRQVA